MEKKWEKLFLENYKPVEFRDVGFLKLWFKCTNFEKILINIINFVELNSKFLWNYGKISVFSKEARRNYSKTWIIDVSRDQPFTSQLSGFSKDPVFNLSRSWVAHLSIKVKNFHEKHFIESIILLNATNGCQWKKVITDVKKNKFFHRSLIFTSTACNSALYIW